MNSKLDTLLAYTCYSEKVFKEEYDGEPLCPGICMNEDCDHVEDVVSDELNGWCEICSTKSVRSGMVLLGEQ